MNSVTNNNENGVKSEGVLISPLGNTTVFGANVAGLGLEHSGHQFIDRDTGEIVDYTSQQNGSLKVTFDRTKFRAQKYALQSTSRSILSSQYTIKGKAKRFRVCSCLRSVKSEDKTVDIYKSKEHGGCHYGGLIICGSVWTCPVCASKITEKKSQIIEKTINEHKKAWGHVLLVTFTTPHTRDDNLGDLLEGFLKAEGGFHKTRAVREIKADIGLIEAIKSLEINYGHANGWHPHSHQLWFVKAGVDIEELKRNLFPHWQKYCVKRGLEAPSFKHGLDIRKGMTAGEYVAKMGWNAAKEVAKGHTKKAKFGSFAPFDLLEEYLENDSPWAKEKFEEYAIATFGKHYISRFPKLQALYNINDRTDEELAQDKEDPADILGTLTFEQWRKVLFNNQRASLLLVAEKHGFEGVLQFIANLKDRDDDEDGGAQQCKRTPPQECRRYNEMNE